MKSPQAKFIANSTPEVSVAGQRWLRIVVTSLCATAGWLQASPIAVPNASFESPATFSYSLNFDGWQRTPQPVTWDTNVTGDWTTLTGVFKNTAPSSPDHIDNCDGNQAAWLFASPGAGIFQDYTSVDWDDVSPTHAFDAMFDPGKSFRLTIGVIGGGYGMLPETPLEASLYYRDALSNKVLVAATIITYSASYFSNRTQFVDFSVNIPVVQPSDAWASQHIGIQLLSIASPELASGYWDVDNVRLTSDSAPLLLNPIYTNGQFQFTLNSEPGRACEILASTNVALPASDWTSLGVLTNVTGTIPFVDTTANFDQRFYQARQLP